MKKWDLIDQATGPGGERFELVRRDDEYVIRANGRILMSSRQHTSEEAMAEVLPPGSRGRVLVGGLGLGYTLRAVLDRMSADSFVDVVELSAAVAAWNRGVLGPLAGQPLQDPRVTVTVGDVRRVIHGSAIAYDAVLLDVDNGPQALTTKSNEGLYEAKSLRALRKTLRPQGVAVFWSAAADVAFQARLADAGFRVDVKSVRAPGVKHVLFVARG